MPGGEDRFDLLDEFVRLAVHGFAIGRVHDVSSDPKKSRQVATSAITASRRVFRRAAPRPQKWRAHGGGGVIGRAKSLGGTRLRRSLSKGWHRLLLKAKPRRTQDTSPRA